MNSFVIIIVIIVILFISVSAIAVIQKREHEKALKRQRIAQYRYRTNQAETILTNTSQLPVGPEARKIILQYGLANLLAIRQISPDDSTNNKNIQSFQSRLENPNAAVDKQKLVIPHDVSLLKKQINGLSNLAKYIVKLNKSKAVSSELVPVAANKIMALIAESKICAYVQQGKSSLENHEYVAAQQSFTMAQTMLTKIKNKNGRLNQLAVELQELIKSSPTEALNTELDFTDKNTADNAPENGPTSSGKEEPLFGQKKKW